MGIGEFVRSLFERHRVLILALAVFTGIILSGQLSNLYSLVASSTTSLIHGGTTTVFFMPRTDTISVGETSDIDIRITAVAPINTIGATIKFDPTVLNVVSISKETSFLDLWTEETSINEDTGEIRFSGGTVRRGGLFGSGTILTLSVRAKQEGRTELVFSSADIFAHDGKASRVRNEMRPLLLDIGPAHETSEAAPKELPPNPDFNNDGHVTLADISILAIQLLAEYSPRYDLDRNGEVNLADVSITFSRMEMQ